jgi:hypothetical protein
MEQINTTHDAQQLHDAQQQNTKAGRIWQLKFENPTGSFWLRGKRAKTFVDKDFFVQCFQTSQRQCILFLPYNHAHYLADKQQNKIIILS